MLGSQTNDWRAKINHAIPVRPSGTFLPKLSTPGINQGHSNQCCRIQTPLQTHQSNKQKSNYAIRVYFHFLMRYKYLEGRDYALKFLFCPQNSGFKHQNFTTEIPARKPQRLWLSTIGCTMGSVWRHSPVPQGILMHGILANRSLRALTRCLIMTVY